MRKIRMVRLVMRISYPKLVGNKKAARTFHEFVTVPEGLR
jgi:hypothetical protein